MALLRGLIDAVRQLPLKHSTYYGCLQLAILARDNGEVTISYDSLAKMTHYSLRTAFRIIARLEELEIIAGERKKISDRPVRHAKNRYRFLIPWDPKTPARLWGSAKKSIGAFFGPRSSTMSSIAAKKKKPEEAILALREGIKNLEAGMRFKTPGTDFYKTDEEELARLQARLAALTNAPEA